MTPYKRGKDNCIQDSYEDAPFASTGGLNKRESMTAPDYIAIQDRGEYIKGYQEQAESMYGADWRTVEFTWKPALTINKKD